MKTLKFILLFVVILLSWNRALAGGDYTLKVGDQQMLSFTPKNGVLFNSMSWRSYDTRCVRVDGPQYTSYTYVTALEPTTSSKGALIQCEYKYQVGSIYMTATEDFYIKVEENKPQEPTSISMQSTLSINVGESYTLYPTVYPSGVSTNITWSSSNNSVASVSSGGRVYGESVGSATIYARTSNGYSALCHVTVSKPTVKLSISNTNTTVPKGTKVALKASPSSAQIFYTLDGTEPTANSNLYTDSITINESLTLKAIGIKEGYKNSDILSQCYNASSFRVMETYPVTGSSFIRSSLIPCITLSEEICESVLFKDIKLYKKDQEVEGDVIISGNSLYFKPATALGTGDYLFSIPSNSFKSITSNESLENIAVEFHIKALHDVVKVETSYGRVMMISSTSNRLYLYGIFPEVKSVNGNYYNQYNSPVYVDYGVSSVSSGDTHFAMIKNSNLYVWGSNISGELGNGSISAYNNPIPTQVISPISKAVCGGSHTIFLQFGNLYSFGWNKYGQLGLGDYQDRYYFRNKVVNISDVKDFDCGGDHNVAILSDNDLYAWGNNKYGQLGSGDNEKRNRPQKIMEDVASAEASYRDFTIILKKDGSLWGTGRNDYGQLGINHTDNVNTPTFIMSDVVKFSAGISHVMAITSDGVLYGWGKNSSHQVKSSSELQYLTPTLIMKNIKDVEAGENCTIAFAEDGTMWVWGSNIDFIKNGEKILSPIPFSNVSFINASSFELKDVEIALDQQYPLYPIFNDSKCDYRSISWETSDNHIVECSENGIIKGVSEGEAIISAKILNFDGTELTASCNVTVTEKSAGLPGLYDDNYNSPIIEVYNLQGVYMGCTLENLSKGLYIVREGNAVTKVIIK